LFKLVVLFEAAIASINVIAFIIHQTV
jgi:hypothetical protein